VTPWEKIGLSHDEAVEFYRAMRWHEFTHVSLPILVVVGAVAGLFMIWKCWRSDVRRLSKS
jgi:hypothetical protein